MTTYLIKGSTIVNEGQQLVADVLIKNGLIEKIGQGLSFEGKQKFLRGRRRFGISFLDLSILILAFGPDLSGRIGS